MPSFPRESRNSTLDPDGAISTPIVSGRCISSFAAGQDRVVWLEHEPHEERVGIANTDGTASTVLVDPPFEVDLASVHIAGGFVYFQAEPAFPDADIVRIPVTGGTPQCVAHVATSADATRNAEFFSIGSPNGAPGCLVRYDEAGTATRLAKVRDNAINSELIIDDEHVYAVSLTTDGPIVLRMPSR